MKLSIIIIAVEGECDRALFETLYNLTSVTHLHSLVTREIKEVIESVKRIIGPFSTIKGKKRMCFYYVRGKNKCGEHNLTEIIVLFEYAEIKALQEILYDLLSMLQHYMDRVNFNLIIHKDCDTNNIDNCKERAKKIIEKLNKEFDRRYVLRKPRCKCESFTVSTCRRFMSCKIDCYFNDKPVSIYMLLPIESTEDVLEIREVESSSNKPNMRKYDICNDICKEKASEIKNKLREKIRSCHITSILNC